MRKIVIQNVLISFISKGILFFTFIYFTKTLSIEKYATFAYVNLILNFLPILQFGSSQGVSILLPKIITKNNNQAFDFFVDYNQISIFLQFSCFVLLILNIPLSFFILLVICLDLIALKLIENIQIYLNSYLLFQESNVIKFFDQLLKPVITLAAFFYYKNIESIFLTRFILTIIVLAISINLNKEKFKLKKTNFKSLISNGIIIYKTGFFLFISWAFDLLFRSIDLWFVKYYFNQYSFAQYGFASSMAMNLWLFAMSYFAPYSNLVYTKVSEGNFDEVNDLIKKTNKNVFYLILFISIIAILIYPFLIKYFIKKYLNSTLLFSFLILQAFLLSINNMYIYFLTSSLNYISLIKIQFILLIFYTLSLFFISNFTQNLLLISGSGILFLLFYFILLRNKYKKIIIKHVIKFN